MTGPLTLVRALGLLAERPSLLALALVPALVALAGMVAAVWGVYTQIDLFVAGWAKPEGWLAGLWWLTWLLEHAARLLIVATVVPWVVMLLGVPLCEPLSMRVEQLLGGSPPRRWASCARCSTACASPRACWRSTSWAR